MDACRDNNDEARETDTQLQHEVDYLERRVRRLERQQTDAWECFDELYARIKTLERAQV